MEHTLCPKLLASSGVILCILRLTQVPVDQFPKVHPTKLDAK